MLKNRRRVCGYVTTGLAKHGEGGMDRSIGNNLCVSSSEIERWGKLRVGKWHGSAIGQAVGVIGTTIFSGLKMPSQVQHQAKIIDATGWPLKIGLMAFLVGSPWPFGSVGWGEQSILVALGMVLTGLFLVHGVACSNTGDRSWVPGALPWILFALGCYSLLQSQPRYEWLPTASQVPPSVSMQRWALGLSPPPGAIEPEMVSQFADPAGGALGCGVDAVPEESRKLSNSMDPVTTRAAAGNLFLAAVLVWISSSVFRKREAYPLLLAAITAVGSLVAIYGLIGAATPKSANWLGLTYGASFSVFVSKNSAGAYLNIALAAAFGLVLWSVDRQHGASARTKSRRPDELPWKVRMAESLRQWLVRLDLVQILALVALLVLAFALLLSLCRGAVVSAMAGVFGTLWLVLPGKKSAGLATAAFLAMTLALVLMVGLQLDERVLSRMESIGELDVETEVKAGRFYIWGVSAMAARTYGWLGSGLGTFHFASLPFQKPTFSGWFYHAESLYAEAWVTLGHCGILVIAVAILVCFRNAFRVYVSERFRDFLPLQVAGVYLLITQTIHSAVDFAFILPGVYIPAAILIGAALGGSVESHRLIAALRRGRSGTATAQRPYSERTESELRGGKLIVFASMGLLMGSMAAMFYSRSSARSLAIAYQLDLEIERDNRLPLERRMEDRVEFLVRRLTEMGGSLTASPAIQRILGDCICHDVRMRQWVTRVPSADPQIAWNQTAPMVMRLAIERVPEDQREGLIRALGGDITIQSIERASDWYMRGQAMSPLDWRLVWGRVSTAYACPLESLAPMSGVMQRTAGHLPQTLISTSILFSSVLGRDDLMQLWRVAIRTNPNASIGIGKIMATLYTDDEVPVDFFPESAPVLRSLASSVFQAKEFPKTHASLRELTVDASRALRWPTLKKAMWMADVTHEAGMFREEIENLQVGLQFNPNDSQLLARMCDRQLDLGDLTGASETIRSLNRAASGDEQVKKIVERLNARLHSIP